jgi:hypothetical protein
MSTLRPVFASLLGGLRAAARGAAAQPDRPAARAPLQEALWLEWLALAGILLFAGWLLGVQGVWGLLLRSDPTGITLVIIVVFTASSLWCGARARELARQRGLFEAARRGAAPPCWAADYLAGLGRQAADDNAPIDVLSERTHGPHATAWWVNALQLKLGLLGKVIGFSVLALEIGQIQNFDAAQSQELLKALTSGLGIALLTTMVGLVGNILLGVQLTRLDRYADALVTDLQQLGVERSPLRA